MSTPGVEDDAPLRIATFDGYHPSYREIRVLDLQPGVGDDAVKCVIRLVSLDSDEEYEALSYVWGPRSDEEEVEISGHRVSITHNLYAALRRLRNSHNKRTIWIDQLCINQLDNDERASQVAMMRDIYRGCSRCVIWLGEVDGKSHDFDTRDASEVFEFVKVAAEPKTYHREDLPVFFRDSDRGRRARKAFEAFSMYGNPWWSRIWTIQEAIIPKSAVFVWGPLSLPRGMVLRTALNLRGNSMYKLFSSQFCSYRVQYTPLLRRLMYPVHGFNHSDHEDGVVDLFMRWRHRDATDPRDKVYALLGLIPTHVLPSAVRCSYDIPIPTLFEQVTVDLIKEECGLRPMLGSCEMPHSMPGLATWAIDFSCTNRVGKRQLKWWMHSHRYREFRADGGKKLRLATVAKGKVLAMSGALIDEVSSVCEVYTVSDSETIHDASILAVIESAKEMMKQSRASRTLPQDYINGQAWDTAFWRTMIGDFVMKEFPLQRADESHGEIFESLLAGLRRQRPHGNAEMSTGEVTPDRRTLEANTFHEQHLQTLLDELAEQGPPNMLNESICGMIPNHAFFMTKIGYIGIGPPDTQAGDQVWVFYGGQVPFITRKTEQDNVYEGNHKLHLVGDAYVHGIMDGEAIRDDEDAQSIWLY